MARKIREAILSAATKNSNSVFEVVKAGMLQGEFIESGWYFYDEAGLICNLNPYPSRALAEDAARRYAEQL